VINKELIKEAIREVISEEKAKTDCLFADRMKDIELTPEQHKEHHKLLSESLKDWAIIKKAFLAGVVTTITGGILGLIWLGIKAFKGVGP
jgi:hypothetical protein